MLIAVCCLLVLGTVAVFAQTARHDFVNCDDNEYVYENFQIQRGFTPASAWWAITQPHSANWHPLTWMSHMIDWQAFGTWDADRQRYVDSWPGGHHLVNVLLHAANAVLLFLILRAMTGGAWPSAVVAALFAIHPLRVESVAWVTERKDMLSGLFFLLTLAAYQAYTTRPFSWWRYGLVVVSFALGLTAKSMLVTLPFVLLLLDYWPLGRVGGGRWTVDGKEQNQSPSTVRRPLSTSFLRLIVEKIPLLLLSAGSCVLTVWAQSVVGAIKPLDFEYRVGNALLSYAAYIGQMFYPAGMVVQYAHPGPNLRLAGHSDRAGGSGLDHAGRSLARSATAIPGRRLVLVCGYARARDRVGAGGRPGPGRPLYLPHADRPVHHDRLGTARPGPGVARSGGFVRRRGRAGHRRAGCCRLVADFALAEQPHLVGTRHRLPARERFCPERVRRGPGEGRPD